MSGNKIIVCDLPKKLLALRRLLFLGVTSIVFILNISAFASLSQESQSKELSLRSALKSSLGEFYKMGDPISLFYFERNYEPFWIENRKRLESLSRSLSEAGSHGLPEFRYPLGELKEAIFEDDPTQKAKLELMATEAFLLFAKDISGGILKPNMIDANINVDPQRREASELLASLTESFDVSSFFENLFPRSNEYEYLVGELRRMRDILRNGSWGDPVPSGTTLQVGMTHEHVPFLRKRLSKMGYPVSQTNQRLFDEQLDASVKKFQEYHGLNPDGVFGKRSIEAINVSPKTRLVQVLVNLERMRWNNQDRGTEYVSVNQANFYAYFKSGNKKVWESRVVIGLPSNQTAEFNDTMTHMVVNPTWHVPKSIAVDEYLPLIQKDSNFLVDNEMVLMVRGTDTIIDSSLIDMQAFTPDNFPFLIKQIPSNINALGMVKFMFPNKFSIYMHDTPMKELFFKDERTFSHGCIRLQEPFEFAYSLLRNQVVDPVNKFQEILKKEEETYINLSRNIPVYITYRTAFFDDFGQVHYRADVYGRDALVYMALADAGVSLY
ncbi:MAG: murein L,D-transpeptidase [Alphaproteobacteria bacterium]|nr:MAG: murein L,D-transpeptidase [Alphaproteobacteria bacterium]